MSVITLPIKCFGAFRRCGESITIKVPEGSSVAQVKQVLGQSLGESYASLVVDSVLANENTILQEQDQVHTGSVLCILPPVCGG